MFVPVEMQPHALQKLLSDAVSDTDVVVFGRFRDFEKGLDEKPDAVLTLMPILKSRGLAATIVGSRGGKSVEPYVLVAAGKDVAANSIATVGAVDILGRQGMRDLVAELLGASPTIERVTKVEDLLPLLQLSSVDAVLLPERLVSSLQARSKLDLRVTPTRGGVGLPGLAILNPAASRIGDSIRRLDSKVSQEMGVGKWD